MSPATSVLRIFPPAPINSSDIQNRSAVVKRRPIVQDQHVTLDATTTSRTISNPLWVIVIAMACFFGAAGLIIAFG